MILWTVLTVLTALVVASLTVPLVRRYDKDPARETNVAILKRQLGEIDAQEASGAIAAEEAAGMRNEIQRRILAEGRMNEGAPRALAATSLPWVAVAVAGVVALAATGLYAVLGRPDLSGPRTAAVQAQTDASGHPVADVQTMVAELEEKMRANPNDPKGWGMLGWSYNSIGRPADAAKAYARAAALDPTNADYLSAEGDAYVNAAQGQVTPDALSVFKAALRIDPADPRSRYYMALHEDQLGQHDQAMAEWIALLNSAPPGAAWGEQLREFVERVARERHIDLTGKVRAVASPPAPSGPTPDQMQSASQMPAGDRDAMIHAMVDRLAGELKANPHNADGWMRLMRARMVLGETDKAAVAYHDARTAFANSPNDLDTIQKAAQSLGVPGA